MQNDVFCLQKCYAFAKRNVLTLYLVYSLPISRQVIMARLLEVRLWSFASATVILLVGFALFILEESDASLTYPRKFLHMSAEGKFKKKEYDIFSPVQNIWQRDSSDDVFTKAYVPRVRNRTKVTGESSGNSSSDITKYRLPLEVVPFHYILELTPILTNESKLGEQWTAPGNIKILVDCVRASDSITLHAFLIKFPGDAIKVILPAYFYYIDNGCKFTWVVRAAKRVFVLHLLPS